MYDRHLQRISEQMVYPCDLSLHIRRLGLGYPVEYSCHQHDGSPCETTTANGVIQSEHHSYELGIARTAIIQEELLNQLHRSQKAIEDHEREAAGWKQRIIRNESAIANGIKR